MPPIAYARHQFPPVVIRHAVWLYPRFTLSYRDVEELLAERGFDISDAAVRRWVLKSGRRSLATCGSSAPSPARAGTSTRW
jgi:putative transposase